MNVGDRIIVRGEASGVFFGTLESRTGKEVHLTDVRRIWWWEGAASLSQLAQSGTQKPESCKFPERVEKIIVLDACELLATTPAAQASIDGVPVWQIEAKTA